MRKLLTFILLCAAMQLISLEPHFMFDPAISPDGEDVCFVYYDKLWTVSWDGGEAKCISSVDRSVSSPQYSPDGKWIAFMSSRSGYQTIYKIPSDGGEAVQISKDDYSLCDWFPDGKSLLVTRHQERYKTEYFQLFFDGNIKKLGSFSDSFSSLNKKGDKIIFCRRGYPYREKYTGSANGDLWIYDIKEEKYVRLTETDLTERYPQFSMTQNSIYFGASDGDVFQLYRADNMDFENRKQLTKFKTWSLRDLDVAYKNDRIVYEYFDKLGKYDPETGKSTELNIEIKQDIIENSLRENSLVNRGESFDVSKDGKLLVFTWKFDLFAMPVKGGEVKQITFDQKGIANASIMDDSETIVFTQYEKGIPQLFRVNIKDIDNIKRLKWSNGKYIEFIDNQNGRLFVGFTEKDKRYQYIAIGDSIGNNIKKIELEDRANYGVFSSDSRYLLYYTTDFSIWSRELKLYDTKTDKSYSIEKTTSWLSSPWWGEDKKSAFTSKSGDIFRIDLQPKDQYYYAEKDNWEEILKADEEKEADADKEEEKEKETKKQDDIKIDFDDLGSRMTRIVSKEGSNYIYHLDEEMIYYINRNEEIYTLHKVEYNGEEDKELHNFGKELNFLTFRNDKWYYQQKNTIYQMPLNGGKAEIIENKFDYDYDDFELNKAVFDQVWLRFGRGFYDPEMHGLNWEKVYDKYAKYVDYAYLPETLGSIVDEMIGEVNASHTGFYPRRDRHFKYVTRAYLGATFDLGNFPSKGIKFQKLYRKSSLALDHGIKAGDVLLKIDGIEVGKKLPFDSLLRDKTGKKIELVIDTGDSLKTVEVKGLGYGSNYDLWYDEWVESRREKVYAQTQGRVAYSHIEGMNHTSYKKFEDELFSKNFDKDALILDIRFNGGGYTHDMILETLTKIQYGWSSSRYGDAKKYPTPKDIWQKPIVLLIDEDSFSDAEIFPILFKHLKLGKVIGMPTSGSVIGTGHIEFMDGSSMRMPSSGWFEQDITNMEGKGASPDIYVPMSPEDYVNDNDKQLYRAVEEILKEIN